MKIYVKEPNGTTALVEVASFNEAITLYPEGSVFRTDPFPAETTAPSVEVIEPPAEKKPRAKTK